MARTYTATLQIAAATLGTLVFQLPASASQCIKIISIFMGQSSDAGDANAQMMRAVLQRVTGTITNGTGGATVTAQPKDSAIGAFSGTVRAGDVTTFPTTAGTATVIEEETFNVQAGWYHTPVPEERWELAPSEKLWVYLGGPTEDFVGAPIALANPITLSARITFEVSGAL